MSDEPVSSPDPGPERDASDTSTAVTRLLLRWRHGDSEAEQEVLALIYEKLKRLAARSLRSRGDQTLQPTALVHEAYLNLVDAEIEWRDRLQFYAFAATVMRNIMVDYARSKNRKKRGGEVQKLSLDEAFEVAMDEAPEQVVALDEALGRLAAEEPRAARVVELHYFSGLGYDEIAELLGVSTPTVSRDLRFARAWLRQELS